MAAISQFAFSFDLAAAWIAHTGLPFVFATWVANKPSQFGYENNINILAKPETIVPELKGSVFNKYQIDGNLIEFPYNSESEIFDLEEIINAICEVE